MRYTEKMNNWKEEDSLWQKASITVESAFVLPLFFFVIVIIISMMDLYRITTLMQTALGEGAKELGMYAYCGEDDSQSPVGLIQDGVCIAYGSKKVREVLKQESLLGIKGGINGITCIHSSYQEGIIRLQAVFFYQSPIGLFRLFPVKIKVNSQARAWTGFHGVLYGDIGEEEEMVYITDWESVYHTSDRCTHLHLSVEATSLEYAKNGKNIYGSKYHPCESCIGRKRENKTVFITKTGEAYHNDSSCGGISRKIKLVKKSETKAFHCCERCGGGA